MRSDLAEKVRSEFKWDELREQRLFNRVLKESALPRSIVARRRVFMAVAASIVFVFGIQLIRRRERAGTLAMQSSPRSADRSRVTMFGDGSKATLSSNATIRVMEDRPEAVRVAQTAGEVLYEVTHDPSRPFVVRAGDVEVRVRGTVFRVGVVDEWVDVHVDRGRVEVDDNTRITMLTPGESLRVHGWNMAAAMHPDTPVNTVSPSPATASVDTDSPAALPSVTIRRRTPQIRSMLNAASAPATADELLVRADAARHAGRWDEAAEVLETFLAHNPHDARFASILFTLGRVERNRGRPAAAALVFARCQQLTATGAISEDALAEEAVSWHLAGDRPRTNAAVQRYIAHYPNGGHAAGMRALLE